MKNIVVELKDNELEKINGGIFDFIILNSSRRLVPENTDKESAAYYVGSFPALPGFP